MNEERDSDHEMEEVLRKAGLETTKEEDERVLGPAKGVLPGKTPSRLQVFLRVAAALLAIVGVAYGVLRLGRPDPVGGTGGTSGETTVATAPGERSGDDHYRWGGGSGGAANRGEGWDGRRTVNLEREPNVGGTGSGPGTGSMYYYDPRSGGAGGGGAGGRIRIQGSPASAGDRGDRAGAKLPGAEWRNAVVQGGLDGKPTPNAPDAARGFPGEDINLIPSGGFGFDMDVEIAEEWNRVRELYGREGRLPPTGEAYDRIFANPWMSPRKAPLSTLSVDVDTAAYANVRRFLKAGQLPPPDAVRIEEMINYFSYHYPQPEGDRPFSVVADAAECPWNPKYRLVRIGVQGRRIEQENVPPRNLVFLLDVSGSMKSEDKLPLVKSAMKLLVGQLRAEDRVAIVTYASGTQVVLEPTSGDQRLEIVAAIDKLHAGGSTNAGSGIQLAYELARRHFEKGAINRVLLATDGDFNVGITDRADLEALITEEREQGVFLTVLGVGTGNLKDSQMEMLADKGNGNYAYLDGILEAQKVLVEQAGATLVTIAKDVKIQVEFNPARVAAYRLVGYENRLLAARDFNDDTKDAGEIGAGHAVTALYEVIPAGVAVPRPEIKPLRYQEGDPAPGEDEKEVKREFADEMLFLSLRYKEPEESESRLLEFPLTDPGAVSINEIDDDFAFSAAVAVFGKLLRNSPDTRSLSFDLAHEIAAGAVGEDESGRRKEFLSLVKAAGKLVR